MSRYYVPDELRMKIGELYEEGYGAKRISTILGLTHVYVGWMLQRYRASAAQSLYKTIQKRKDTYLNILNQAKNEAKNFK